MVDPLIPPHGGYRTLKSFKMAELVYDVTVRFCDRYISKRSRTHDQMVQAARSGVQNIVEGSQASGTSKKFELKLTSVARASLEELKRDYLDHLRQRELPIWTQVDPRRVDLVARRLTTVDEVAGWIHEVRQGARPSGQSGPSGSSRRSGRPLEFTSSSPAPASTSSQSTYPEISANAALTLTNVTGFLLDRQIAALAKAFQEHGGFTERLYRVRQENRKFR